MKNKTTTALITGASSGIGYELAKLFAANHHPLILVARREQQLQNLSRELQQQYQINIKTIALDLAQAGAAESLFKQIQHEPITFLVNNAGFGNFDDFVNIDLVCERELLQLNIITLTELTKLCLPIMLRQQLGYILNVASVAAFQPGPYMATYFASKSYVLSFSQALAHELRQQPVSVTCLCPGTTESEFHSRANITHTRLFRRGVMTAKEVAQAGYNGMLQHKRIVIPGMKNKFLAFATRFAPRHLATTVSGWLLQQRR